MSLPKDLVARIANGDGSLFRARNGHMRRANRATVVVRGIEFLVEYVEGGVFMAATATDDSEMPWCEIKSVECGGFDFTNYLTEAQTMELCERIESSWRAEDV